MANRSYLYRLSHRPAAYADRPERIGGLGEWPYDVPFMFRLLMSDDPQPCASLIADGLQGDDGEDRKFPVHAIGSRFDGGFARVQRFVAILQAALDDTPPPAPAPPRPAGLFERLMQRWRPPPAPVPPPSTEALRRGLDETLAFLASHRDEFLLLETIELDVMSESEEDALRECVAQEIGRCHRAGLAVDALPADPAEAARRLRDALAQPALAPLDAFAGLRLDDDCDSTRSGATQHPLGLCWSEELYFSLANRAEFEALRRAGA